MHEFGSSTATSLCWLVSYWPLATLGARPPSYRPFACIEASRKSQHYHNSARDAFTASVYRNASSAARGQAAQKRRRRSARDRE